MSIAYRSSATGTVTGTTLTLSKPTGVVDGDVMLALVACNSDTQGTGGGAFTAPAGWAQISTTRIVHYGRVALFWKRASSEGASYDFAASFSGTTVMVGQIVAYSGCDPSGDPFETYSDVGYTAVDTVVKATGLTTTISDDILAIIAYDNVTSYPVNPPSGWTERVDTVLGAYHVYACDKAFSTPGTQADVTYNGGRVSVYKHAYMVALVPQSAPGTPTISSPETNALYNLSETVSLTATATDPNGDQVKYRWKYDSGSGDVTIGDTGLVDSGEPGTYSWDIGSLPPGTYTLKCWTVDAAGLVSASYAAVTIVIVAVVVTAPADESSHISGEITLTGKGYLSAAGQLRLQWEVDSHNPPDPESADYDLITSALVDQGEDVSVTANATHLGTWYFRARTLDTEAATSDWTAVPTIYVLERLRLLPGSQVKRSLGKWANRVYCVVEQSSPLIVAVATNTTVSPTYAESPREIVIVAPPGSDLAGAQAIANAHLVLRMDPSTQLKLSGLQVRLVDGMKLARGQRVGIVIERDDIDATLPIIELTYDVSAAVCEVTVGNWWEPKTMSDYLLAIAQKVQQLEKEAATA